MSLQPDIPDFAQESSIQRLHRIDTHAYHPEVDVAVAQDVLHKRIKTPDLQKHLSQINDYSTDGDSVSSWVYRLGGADAVKESLFSSSVNERSRETLAGVAGNMIGDNEWIHKIAREDKSVQVISTVLRTAIERDDEEAVDVIASRMDELKPVKGSFEEAIYSHFHRDIANHRLKKALVRGEVQKREIKPVLPFADDERFIALEQKRRQAMIPTEEAERQKEEIFRQRGEELSAVVADAVLRKDMGALQHYLHEGNYTDNLLEMDRIRFTLGELSTILLGVELLEKGVVPVNPQKHMWELNSIDEAEWEFEKEAAKYSEQFGQTEEGLHYRQRITPIADRAYWLTMRLGELQAVPSLKKIVDHQYASTEVKKEAVRQLLLAGEAQFLKGFALKAVDPVNFWDIKVRLDRRQVDEAYEKNSEMNKRIDEDLPSYVAAIIE